MRFVADSSQICCGCYRRYLIVAVSPALLSSLICGTVADLPVGTSSSQFFRCCCRHGYLELSRIFRQAPHRHSFCDEYFTRTDARNCRGNCTDLRNCCGFSVKHLIVAVSVTNVAPARTRGLVTESSAVTDCCATASCCSAPALLSNCTATALLL